MGLNLLDEEKIKERGELGLGEITGSLSDISPS
jgi:hypothetical protein